MTESPERSWLSRTLLPDGTEPDARFTLANERTFLAWIRTALALLGGGVALEAFAVEAFDPTLRRVTSGILVCTALLVSLNAVIRWVRVERSMRRSHPLPVSALIPVLALGIALASGIVVGLIVFLGA